LRCNNRRSRSERASSNAFFNNQATTGRCRIGPRSLSGKPLCGGVGEV
jgi:hypothetical protein